jgi:alpha-beta hydrolase superfamily lysophospholipase
MTVRSTQVGVPAYNTRLLGDLSIPEHPNALVLLAHTSMGHRRRPRERQLLGALHARGLAALRIDLLTQDEAGVQARRTIDLGLLAKRLLAARNWVTAQAQFANLPVICVGTGIGAAAAMSAAASQPNAFHALVSMDGWMDQVASLADGVRAPTLLVVAAENREAVAANERVVTRLRSLKQLAIVNGATDLLGDQGSIDEAAGITLEWLTRFLGLPPSEGTMPA